VVPIDHFQATDSAAWPPIVGVLKEHLGSPALDRATADALRQVIEVFRTQGVEVRELSVPIIDEFVVPAYYITACAEASSNLARFDGVRYGVSASEGPESSERLIKASRALFGHEVKLRILLGTFVLRAGHYERFYGRAQQARRQIAAALDSVFESVSMLITPTVPTQAFLIGEFMDDPVRMKLADQFTVTANLAGLPAISLPVGVTDGLPTAVQLMTRRFHDMALLRVASWLEERLQFDPSMCPFANLEPRIDPDAAAAR
jgi:aspartyl-tRNA(Asn)/glutamyl-tRNA(Gln) amidotransferase subunit A